MFQLRTALHDTVKVIWDETFQISLEEVGVGK